MALKLCLGCGLRHAAELFYQNKTARDGGNICLACKRVRDARSRKKHRRRIKRAARKWWAANLERGRKQKRASDARLRDSIIKAYGSRCACCGEKTPQFLTIDHPNNDGSAHRRAVGSGKIYADLRRRGYPPPYRLLCWNCNCARGRYGRCPHEDA